MSAIWGIITSDSQNTEFAQYRTLFESTYRASCKIDRYEGICTKDAFFGCGIQYITSESERETLPLYDTEHGILFTADCILDNRNEVIQLLVKHGYDTLRLSQAPDGTLMYFSYLVFGTDCVQHFRGLYSIALWEEATSTLTLISDHTASRSLYYTRQNGYLAFSTRMEPLRKLFPDLKPNAHYYKDFLLANPSLIYITPGETAYEGISLLTPATTLRLTRDTSNAEIYWSPDKASRGRRHSSKGYRKEFLKLYDHCVRDALRTSGEVGIAMSSGLDSSTVGVLAAKALTEAQKTLHSYTFVPFKTPPAFQNSEFLYDESELIRELAGRYPNIRPSFHCNQGKNLFADMKLCCNILEMPYKSAPFPNQYELCTEGAAAGCKVFLNGAFGNNTVSFGHINNGLYHLGRKKKYLTFLSQMYRYAKHEQLNPKTFFLRTLALFRKFHKQPKEFKKYFIPDNIFVSPSILNKYDPEPRFKSDPRTLLSNGFLRGNEYPLFLQAPSLLMYLGIFETQFGLCTGMLLRDPTKDIRIIEFCSRLPFHLFTHKGTPRWLIRSSFSTMLPDSFLNSWTKQGILNADWLIRVQRDWHLLKPQILQHLSSSFLDECIDKERVCAFLDTIGPENEPNSKLFDYICAIEGLYRYYLDE